MLETHAFLAQNQEAGEVRALRCVGHSRGIDFGVAWHWQVDQGRFLPCVAFFGKEAVAPLLGAPSEPADVDMRDAAESS